MIVFPSEFVATKYPGYYWNTKLQVLYSIKIQGILRPLKLQQPWWIRRNHFGMVQLPVGYSISVKGKQLRYALTALKKLTVTKKHEVIVPVS